MFMCSKCGLIHMVSYAVLRKNALPHLPLVFTLCKPNQGSVHFSTNYEMNLTRLRMQRKKKCMLDRKALTMKNGRRLTYMRGIIMANISSSPFVSVVWTTEFAAFSLCQVHGAHKPLLFPSSCTHMITPCGCWSQCKQSSFGVTEVFAYKPLGENLFSCTSQYKSTRMLFGSK